MRRTTLFLVFVLSLASAAIADVPQPEKSRKPAKSIDTSLSIRLVREAREATLIIPRDQVQQLRAELDQLDAGPEITATAGGVLTRTQTLVSGTLLSLACIFGGMWFVRSGRSNSKPAVAAAILLACGSIATMVYGNAGPPPEARSITGKMFSAGVHDYKSGWGAIKLQVSDTERNPVLIVPDPPKAAAE